mmetsp:Transcript_70188/g.183953  ORF Transcript_70188/g.183953 Transcript_70188/m.183953 type:complete len:499 (+) Transcript_70188:127-1623(+)
MASVPMHMRADRAIIKRQAQEHIHEQFCAGQLDQFKVAQKGLWEHKTVATIKNNRVKAKAAQYQAHHQASLQDRRRSLAEKLSREQKAYEQEMVDKQETTESRMDKMAMRAYELKKKREDERKAFVQEKLYQQWRSGIDDLRTMDTNIVELKCIAERDFQLDEKAARVAEEKDHDEFYNQLWIEGYHAKGEREAREKDMKAERNELQKRTLGIQLAMKGERVSDDKLVLDREAEEMKKLWLQQEVEEKEAEVRKKFNNRENRKKADEFMAIQMAQKEEEESQEKAFDKAFVASVLERERKMSEMEELERAKAKKQALLFNEALKLEMAKKAESEEELVRLQLEESERQWQKRYDQWEVEELARRALLEEVYSDRAEQVMLKQHQREQLKEELLKDRDAGLAEVERLSEMDRVKEEGERAVAQRHQEELFRQMDFHQVQRHRQLQQHAIEQRQAAIAEEKIRRAVSSEKEKATSIMHGVLQKRAADSATKGSSLAPWEK